MITDALLDATFGVLGWLTGWLPKVTTMPDWYTGWSTYMLPAAAGWLSVPVVGTILQACIAGLVIVAAYYAVQVATWVIGLIRG